VVIIYYIVIELKNHWLRLVFLHEDTTSILKCHAIRTYWRIPNVIRKMLDIQEERFDRALKHLFNSGLIDITTDDENFYIRRSV
jgi:hypothetical protein